MTTKKKIEKLAKSFFKQSLTDGLIDEGKVRKNLNLLTSLKPPGLVQILKIFKRLTLQKLSKEEVLIETADKKAISEFEPFFLRKTQARKIKYRQNPKIIFGAKIIHGDWIWDATLQAKLEQLTVNN